MSDSFNPNLRTPVEDLSPEEINKINSNGMRGTLHDDVLDRTRDDLPAQSEQIAKSYGIYLEFDRAKTGSQKDWMYMVRITIPGGGPLNRDQWRIFEEIARKYTTGPRTGPSLRLTTRQNIQLHWIKKDHLINAIHDIARAGLTTLNGCGDNTRNVMACPLSRFSKLFNGGAWAQRTAAYFELPQEPYLQIFEIDTTYSRPDGTEEKERSGDGHFAYGKNLLNRKFKIAFSSAILNGHTGRYEPDNCVEALTNDMSIVPVLENDRVAAFQVHIGGGQGEKWGKPTTAALGKALCRVDEAQLLKTLDAVVKVHQEWGDRQNRHWARLKYVVKARGVAWYRERMEELLGFTLELPDEALDIGDRMLHHGWIKQENSDLWSYGAFIENGRLTDSSPNGRLLTMVGKVFDALPSTELLITPNQDLLFTNIEEAARPELEAVLRQHGFGTRNGKPYSTLRLHSGACVGRDTCRLTYTDSEQFEPELIDQLEALGWGDLAESIGITGCERQCFRPSTKTIGLVGSGVDRYQLRLMGTEDARHQGGPLLDEDRTQMYLRSIPREQVSTVLDTLFRHYMEHRDDNEDLGYFLRRQGPQKVIDFLREAPATAALMEKTVPVKAYLEA